MSQTKNGDVAVTQDSTTVFASCMSFMVNHCADEAAEMLRRGLYSAQPIVSELLKHGLHEKMKPLAMRHILGDLPWAKNDGNGPSLSDQDRRDVLTQILSTKKGVEVASQSLALLRSDNTLMMDYLREMMRCKEIGNDQEPALLMSMMRKMHEAGMNINPISFMKGRGSGMETPLGRLMAGYMEIEDSQERFAARLETAKDFMSIGVKFGEAERHNLLINVPLSRIPCWMQMLSEHGYDLTDIGKPFDLRETTGKSKGIYLKPIDPERLALAAAWLAQQSLKAIRNALPAP